MTKIAILGAGGKMGCRLTDNLLKSQRKHELMLVEVSDVGRKRINERGLTTTDESEALTQAEALILALPDHILGKVAHQIAPKLNSGTIVITLDPAAAHAGELPPREDISYFVTHPCHPNVFDSFETVDERDDFFGGVHARQAIVCSLMQGPDEHFAIGESLACEFYGPVTRSHRITLEQMAILEPTMAETCGIALIKALREVMEEAVRRGVPREAAADFMYGHIKFELGIAFGLAPFPFSDGATLISEYGKQRIFQPNWLDVFEPESVRKQTKMIVDGVGMTSASAK